MKNEDFALDVTFGEMKQGEEQLVKQLEEERAKASPDFAKIVLIGTALEAVRVTLAHATKGM